MLERRLAEAESYTCAFLEAAERRAAEELMAAVDRLHAAQRDVAGAGNTAATRALERQALDQAAVASAVALVEFVPEPAAVRLSCRCRTRRSVRHPQRARL